MKIISYLLLRYLLLAFCLDYRRTTSKLFISIVLIKISEKPRKRAESSFLVKLETCSLLPDQKKLLLIFSRKYFRAFSRADFFQNTNAQLFLLFSCISTNNFRGIDRKILPFTDGITLALVFILSTMKNFNALLHCLLCL